NTGYHVDSVSVDGLRTDSTASYTFTNVTAPHAIFAAFAVNIYSIAAAAESNGSISPVGAVSVEHGASQTFNLTPNACYHIDSVIINRSYRGTMSSYTFNNVRGDSTIRAVFKINTYTITPTAGANGTISPPNPTGVNCGSSQPFNITANSCYHIDSVIVNGA